MPSRREQAQAAVPRGPADPALGGVSLVFPVHNESFIIEQTLRNYIAELQGRVPDLEVIVAEDGSTDDTKVVLERLAQELPIRLYMSDERKGYQQAMIDAVASGASVWAACPAAGTSAMVASGMPSASRSPSSRNLPSSSPAMTKTASSSKR